MMPHTCHPLILLLTVLLFVTGCRTSLPDLPPEPKPWSPPPLPLAVREPYFSVMGRLIPYTVLGKGPVNVHVHSAIHGNEPEGIELCRRLEQLLLERPGLWQGMRIIFVQTANPDGLHNKTRFNENGVDLNRNFPARNWRLTGRRSTGSSGSAPGSEPETRALVDLFKKWPPALVLTLHSAAHCVNWDGPCADLAKSMGRLCGYKVKPSIGYPTPGSLGSWLGKDRNIPIITLELHRASADILWKENRESLVEAFRWLGRKTAGIRL